MRDAFGGVFTMNFLLVFIFIYVAFTAVSLNYAKAFKVKNAVIDFVEQQEIADLDDYFGILSTKDTSKLDEELMRLNYYKTCEQVGYNTNNTTGNNFFQNIIQNITNIFNRDGYCYKGVVIEEDRRETIEGTNSEVIYYKIKTYADWNLGALNKLLVLAGRDENSESVISGMWTVNGEAKVVYKK